MSFIDYSGQVILDIALTDEGRARLARADGSFRFAKFAVGDTPINYALYNPADSRGEAYYDADILATPVFEALTDNAIAMSSKLISINKTNLLYLPVLELNTVASNDANVHPHLGMHVVCVDEDTELEFLGVQASLGFMGGVSLTGAYCRLDQGLDTVEISPATVIDAELLETQYLIEIDNRFGGIVDTTGVQASPNSVDDDNIAGYFLTLGANPKYISKNTVTIATNTQVIRGSRGTILTFRIKASIDLNSTTALFARLGTSTTTDADFYGTHGPLVPIAYSFIDAIVKVTGGTLGGTVNVPVRFVKLT